MPEADLTPTSPDAYGHSPESAVQNLAPPAESDTNAPLKRPAMRPRTRYPVQWRAAVRLSGQGGTPIQGKTMDVSLTGCAVVIPDNICPQQVVTLYLQLPMNNAGQPGAIIEAEARIVHAALSAQCKGFRLGLHFLRFRADGLEKLTAHLGITLPQAVIGKH